jgi:hypothetical protein
MACSPQRRQVYVGDHTHGVIVQDQSSFDVNGALTSVKFCRPRIRGGTIHLNAQFGPAAGSGEFDEHVADLFQSVPKFFRR